MFANRKKNSITKISVCSLLAFLAIYITETHFAIIVFTLLKFIYAIFTIIFFPLTLCIPK